MNAEAPETEGTAATSPNWWLDPALAKLAFGAGSKEYDRADVWGREERLDLDLSDPDQRALGEFELLELIGEGGMGLVYRARQTRLQREVAVKLLSAGPWASPDFVARFKQEAQHAAQLQHPGIVTVFEMGELDGLVYFAMQLVRGESLAQRLQRSGGRMPGRDAAVLMRTVAEAVAYAHSLGVLHLDLKPGNVLLDDSGVPRVADFGLARRIDPERMLNNEHIAGTPSYMAPEQASVGEHPLTQASDVWGLGAILYELLTGRPPFEGSSAVETLDLLRKGRLEAPSRYLPVAPDLEAICLKCLTMDPSARYPDARALADDLGRYVEGREVSVRPLTSVRRIGRWARREPWLAATASIAILALIVGMAATSLQWMRAERNAAVAQSNAVESSARLWESRRETALRLEQNGEGYLAMRQLLTNIEEQESSGAPGLAASDRLRFGIMASQGATLIDAIAIPDANPLAVALNPSGSVLAIACNDQTVRWYATATLVEIGRVTLAGRSSSSKVERAPLFLKFTDEQRLLVTLDWYGNYVAPANIDSWLVDLERAQVVEPPPEFADFADANYSADGRHALLRNRSLQAQLWQVSPWRALSGLDQLGGIPSIDFLPTYVGRDAGFAAVLLGASREMLWLSPTDLSRRSSLRFPGQAGVAAWMNSHDGRLMAFGDYEGRVFVFDIVTRVLRTFPTSRGREITWLAFSEDDKWLAASSWDGSVYAFDVARGDALVAGQMQHDFAPLRIGISRERRMLVVSGEGKSALWHLPETGPRAVSARRVGAGPAPHGLAGRYASDWSFDAGLMATAGIDGQVRLWRLPRAPLMQATAARQIGESADFDGQRVVDVDWNRLRIVTTRDQAVTSWMEFAQPPGFAELLAGGSTLVVTIGAKLHVFDVPSLAVRYPAIALSDTPQQLVASADGRWLLLAFGVSGGPTGLSQRLRVFDLMTGQAMPGEAVLAGPLRTISFSADASRVLAVGPAEDVSTLLAVPGLKEVASYPHDPFQPVVWGSIAPAGGSVWLVTSAQDARLGDDQVLLWNPEADAVNQRVAGQSRPLGIIATLDGAFLTGEANDQRSDADLNLARLRRTATSAPTANLALDRSGTLVAQAYRSEVQLHDAATGANIGPPLQGSSNALDFITSLAFSPASDRLLARTLHGRWLTWSLDPMSGSTALNSAVLARLDPDAESQRVLHPVAQAERRRLRGKDPGRWTRTEPRRGIPLGLAARVDASVIPPRSDESSPWMLDLGPVTASGPEGVRNTFYSGRPQMRPYPAGVQRFGGVDYELRGIFEIGGRTSAPDARNETEEILFWKLPCVPVPGAPVRAVWPLMMSSVPVRSTEEIVLAELVWHYADGTRAVTPLRTQHELAGYAGLDSKVPLVFGNSLSRVSPGTQGETLSSPRLLNPDTGRSLRCVSIESMGPPASVLVLAITAEPMRAEVPGKVP